MAANTTAEVKRALHTAYTNGKYHSDRESFFDFYDRLITFGVLATGCVAFFEVFGRDYQKFGAGVLSLFALAQLVFALSVKARNHAGLKRRYFDIAADLKRGGMNSADAQAEMLKMVGEEPPPYNAVHALAENWATTAVYGESRAKPCTVTWWRRSVRNWLRQEAHDFGC